MKNILLVNYYSYENGGGISSSCFLLASELIRQGDRVFIASTGTYPGIDSFIFKDFRYIPFFGFRDLYLSWFLNKVIEKNNIDLVHAYDYRFSALGSLSAAKKNKIPCVIHYHDYWFECLRGDLLFRGKNVCSGASFLKCLKCQKRVRLFWEIYKYFNFRKKQQKIKDANGHFAVSEYVLGRLRMSGFYNNVFKTYNPVQISKQKKGLISPSRGSYEFVADKFTVTFIGRICFYKGIDIFLRVAYLVSQKNANINFLLVGDGDMVDDCYNFIYNNNAKNIKLIRRVDYRDIGMFYEASDIIFSPSVYHDPFPMVVLEALSFGKVFLGSNMGGISEIIQDNISGFLINPNNIEGFVAKILDLEKDRNLRRKIEKGASERARDFEDVKIAKNISEIYEKIINEKRNK